MSSARTAALAERPISSDAALRPLGTSATYHWRVNETVVDMAMPLPAPRRAMIACAPQSVTVDLNRTALIVIDMQNDFCAKNGWVDHLGVDYTPDRAPIAPLQRLLPHVRNAGVPVIWVNWGNRPDLLNMPPNQIHLYKPHGVGIGLGEPLPSSGAHVLEKDSWAAAVVDELKPLAGDIDGRQVQDQRLLGYAARQHPQESRNAHNSVRGREYRPVRILHAHRCELPRLWLRDGRGLLRDHIAGLLHRGHDLEREEVLRLRHPLR